MFTLKVGGLAEANALIRDQWPTRIVSLMSEVTPRHGKHHLHIQVADVRSEMPYVIYPTLVHLRRVLAFTEDLTDDDRLLVHCFAGQSRSTAIAIAICIQHGMQCIEAFAYVEQMRTFLLPNELFIRHIDKHFNLQGVLVTHVATHRQAQLQAMIQVLSDLGAP